MKPEMSNQQLTRLLPETVMAIEKYRRKVKRETGKTPSINGTINAMILIGWDAIIKQDFIDNGVAQMPRKDTTQEKGK